MSLGLNLNITDAVDAVTSTVSDYNTAGSITPPNPSTTNLESSAPSLDRTLDNTSILDNGPPPLSPTVPSPSLPSLPGAGNTLGIPLPNPEIPFNTPPISDSLATNDATGLVTGLLSNPAVMDTIKSASGLDMTLPDSVTNLVNDSIASDAFSVVAGAGAAIGLKSGILGLSLNSCNPNISLPKIPKLGDFFGIPAIPEFSFNLPKLKSLGIKSLIKNTLCNTASGLSQLPSLTSALADKVGDTEVARDILDGMNKVVNAPGVDDVMYGIEQSGLLNNSLIKTISGDKSISSYIDRSVAYTGNTKDPSNLLSTITNTIGGSVDTINTVTSEITDDEIEEVNMSNANIINNITNLAVKSNMDKVNLPIVDDEEAINTVDKATVITALADAIEIEKII